MFHFQISDLFVGHHFQTNLLPGVPTFELAKMNDLLNFFRPPHSSPSIMNRLFKHAKSDWKQGFIFQPGLIHKIELFAMFFQGDEEDQWGFKAIESLLKKLKKDRSTVEKLEHALEAKISSTDCVTIVRSLDGRLQVSRYFITYFESIWKIRYR